MSIVKEKTLTSLYSPPASATDNSVANERRNLAPLLLLGMASFLSQFDVTALAVALPTIREALQLSTAGGAWVIDTYSLAFAASLLPAGFIADRWGRRRVLIAGLLIFALASVGCALAESGASLWIWRGVQGVGAACLTCAMLAMMSLIYPQPEDRMWAFGWVGTISGLALIIGPAGGGLLASWLGWSAIFWVNPPICALLAIGCWRCLKEQTGQARSRAGLLPILIGAAAIVGAVWSLLEGAHRGWRSAVVIAPAVAAVVAIVGLLIWLRRVDASVNVRRGFANVCAIAALQSAAYWTLLIYLPLAANHWFQIDSAQAGVLLLAVTAPMLLLPSVGARLARQLGLRWLFVAGMTAVFVADLMLWKISSAPSFTVMLLAMLLAGCGAGLMNSQLSGAFVGHAQPHWAAMASAVGITMRQLGYALGIALLGALVEIGPIAYAASFGVASFAALLAVAIAYRLPHR